MRGAPFAKEAYQIISELNSKGPYALCLKGGWSVRQRYINLVYFLIVFLLALSFVSIYVFPDLFLIFYVLAVNIVPISAAHFCSGFILKSIDMDSDYNSRFMNAALIHPGFLKIIYFGVGDERVDRRVLVFCRNCHFFGFLGLVSIFAIGIFKN